MSTEENKEFEKLDADHRLYSLLSLLYEVDLRSLKNKLDKMKKEEKCAVSSIPENQTRS